MACTSRGSNPDHRCLRPVLSPIKVLVLIAARCFGACVLTADGGSKPALHATERESDGQEAALAWNRRDRATRSFETAPAARAWWSETCVAKSLGCGSLSARLAKRHGWRETRGQALVLRGFGPSVPGPRVCSSYRLAQTCYEVQRGCVGQTWTSCFQSGMKRVSGEYRW